MLWMSCRVKEIAPLSSCMIVLRLKGQCNLTCRCPRQFIQEIFDMLSYEGAETAIRSFFSI